ncbi:hypothetical protein VTL71DRAFT_9479 [Oculimacula yallundae]|uniref:2EXR domain-containing protein n=1 Tax=Oculimacula yallundae TaxID=86028 RepID=A0ABR4BS14_9HELO
MSRRMLNAPLPHGPTRLGFLIKKVVITFLYWTESMDVPPTDPYGTFHLFPSLPAELRGRIWKLAANFPRTVTIKYYPLGNKRDERFTSPGPVAALMQTCRESRAWAGYTQSFTAPIFATPVFDLADSKRYIWINFDNDTIQISDHALTKVKTSDISFIRHVIVEVQNRQAFVEITIDTLRKLRALESLRLLCHENFHDWDTVLPVIISSLDHASSGYHERKGPSIRIIQKSTGKSLAFWSGFGTPPSARGQGGRGQGGGGPPLPPATVNGLGRGRGWAP